VRRGSYALYIAISSLTEHVAGVMVAVGGADAGEQGVWPPRFLDVHACYSPTDLELPAMTPTVPQYHTTVIHRARVWTGVSRDSTREDA